MKKIINILMVLILMGSLSYAESSGRGIQIKADIGPTDTLDADLTISAAGASLKNCITDLIVHSTNTYTLRVLDGTTTNYTLVAPADHVERWERSVDTAFCGSNNTALEVKIEVGVGSDTQINHIGFVR